MSRCITYGLQVVCTHNWPSVPHVELQESALCKHKTRHVGVTKSIDAATAGDHRSRCGHRLRLQLPLPLSLILFGSSRSEWICNDPTGFWIRDGGRKVFKTVRGVGVIAIPNAGLDTTRRVEVPPGAGVLRLLATGVAVGVLIDRRCVADGVEVRH